MLAYILALAVGLGSFALYMAAFFFPEIHRKSDFIWSSIGLFYALVLWVCAGRITGGVLLGQTASVALLGWFGWQTLSLRRDVAPPGQRTQLPSNLNPDALREKLTGLTSSEGLSGVKGQATRLLTTVKDRVQGSKTPTSAAEPTSTSGGMADGGEPTAKSSSGASSNPMEAVMGLVDTTKQAIAKITQLGKKPSRPTIVLNHPPKETESETPTVTVEAVADDDFEEAEPAIASASTAVDTDEDQTEVLAAPTASTATDADVLAPEEAAILNNTVPPAPEVLDDVVAPTEFTDAGTVADTAPTDEAEPTATAAAQVVENPLGDPFVPTEPTPADAAEIDLAPPAEPIGAGDPRERQLEEADVNAPPIEPATYTMVEPEQVEEAIAASEAETGSTPELKRPNPPNPFLGNNDSESSGNPET